MRLNILRTADCPPEEVDVALAELRRKLSPQGDLVSAAGRKKTLEVFGEALSPAQVVQRICQEVRDQGLAAVLDYGQRLDGRCLTAAELRVPAAELAAAHAAADADFLATVRRVRDNIWDFQRAILHRDVAFARADGVRLRQRYVPLRRVGLCVPGGAAAYPSTVLMTAIPAQAAGVEALALIAPPTALGAYNQDILATCHEVGITEVYRVGGAQGVAALAYGVEGMAAVDKIVGPGNLFVALAKKAVFGEVAIDSIAGPSEIVLLADHTTPPAFAAADLLAQAEHNPGASILITWDAGMLQQTIAALEGQLQHLDRADVTRTCLEEFGALLLVRDRAEACQIANDLAPEHLHLAAEDPEELLEKIPQAGACFLGPYSPVALGDYFAGPSHVLPTGGTARWASGLSANDFLRSSSVIEYNREALLAAAPDIVRLAQREQLTAHAASVTVRIA